MKLVFAGTPAFAATALEALVAAGHEVVLALTQPDRPAGRGLTLHPSAVKTVATAHDIPVLQPRGLRLDGRHADEARDTHERLAAAPHDAMVVAAYGLILPPSILEIPELGCLNIHASLLPRWRGAAPIQRAIEAGDSETGVTIMQMDAGLDTGAIRLVRTVAIAPTDTAGTLTETLASLGATAIVEALERLVAGTLPSQPQPDDPSRVTYAAKLTKAEARADFTRDARSFVDRIRAFDPWPGCNADLQDGTAAKPMPYRIWKAQPFEIKGSAADQPSAPGQVLGFEQGVGVIVATGSAPVVLTELQKPGGKRLPATLFARDFVHDGLRFEAGP